MTIQDLKNKRNEIIEFATEKDLDVKYFMTVLAEGVEFGLNETEDVMEYVEDIYDNTFKPRKRNKVAESRAKAEFEGRVEEFDTKAYFANKNRY